MKAIIVAMLAAILSACSHTPITECSANGTRMVLVPNLQTGVIPVVEYCDKQ